MVALACDPAFGRLRKEDQEFKAILATTLDLVSEETKGIPNKSEMSFEFLKRKEKKGRRQGGREEVLGSRKHLCQSSLPPLNPLPLHQPSSVTDLAISVDFVLSRWHVLSPAFPASSLLGVQLLCYQCSTTNVFPQKKSLI